MAFHIRQWFEYQGDDWWKWAIWLDGPEGELDLVEFVTYTLHPTFANPVRQVDDRSTKFPLETAGWGTFTIFATPHSQNGEETYLQHELFLEYPEEPVTRGRHF